MIQLPNPPESYDPEYISRMRDELQTTDEEGLKKTIDNVIETGSIILKSPDGSYFKLTVSNSGTLSTSSVSVDSQFRPKASSNPYA